MASQGAGKEIADILDYIDNNGLAAHVFKALGIPASVVRGQEEVQEMRDQREMQQQQQAEMAEAMQVAESAGKAAPALQVVNEMTEPPEAEAG